ncbi:hypothetical protein KRR55_06260 [Paeniglutamicibacter sp. ABSL32-1]|uniref:hypothetical protein n=1 Tax=Paeniglutamicibacter quisquiliarum TaxID=2849498 RepID=UPI001C2D4265|nr:hypothetical protein [Paeniglutamicibacter quisquiliarum]MBV1778715.1 hypothetical protein [Paeniglutamicibacter quisquiliarum]
MDQELFELCIEVHKRFPGWNDTLACWERTAGIPEGEPYIAYPELERLYGLWGTQELKTRTPLYTTDYLLEKLPQDLVNDNEVHPFTLYRGKYSKQWLAGYEGYFGGQNDPSDTPLKALLKLVIALVDAGELSR